MKQKFRKSKIKRGKYYLFCRNISDSLQNDTQYIPLHIGLNYHIWYLSLTFANGNGMINLIAGFQIAGEGLRVCRLLSETEKRLILH